MRPAANVLEPRLIAFPTFCDDRGSIAVIEFAEYLPFTPKRFYYIYDSDPKSVRGAHSHWKEQELILALRGTFRVRLDDGRRKSEYVLDRADVALYVPPSTWHEVFEFSAGSVCAVFASEPYNKEDNCVDYQQFIRNRDQYGDGSVP